MVQIKRYPLWEIWIHFEEGLWCSDQNVAHAKYRVLSHFLLHLFFLEKLMIKSFHILQDTQLWDRNPHKQGKAGNISLIHMNLVRLLIPAKLVNLVIVMIKTECLLLMVVGGHAVVHVNVKSS